MFFFYKLQTSPDKQPQMKTVGPLTDADVIKLRPCEKKQVYLSQPTSFQKCIFSANSFGQWIKSIFLYFCI